MKNILILVLISTVFVACSSIEVRKDPFKNSTVVTMDMDHSADIEGFGKSVTLNGSQYSREIKENKKLPTTILFKMIVTPNITSLSSEAYIRVDDKITKLSLTDMNSTT